MVERAISVGRRWPWALPSTNREMTFYRWSNAHLLAYAHPALAGSYLQSMSQRPVRLAASDAGGLVSVVWQCPGQPWRDASVHAGLDRADPWPDMALPVQLVALDAGVVVALETLAVPARFDRTVRAMLRAQREEQIDEHELLRRRERLHERFPAPQQLAAHADVQVDVT